MNSNFYLPRNLFSDDKTYTETELLAASNYIVVLAEPGGGKTELMNNLAQQLGTQAVTARKFWYLSDIEENLPLIIDAFDEFAKVDSSGIDKILSKAQKSKPTSVCIASRSSEWDNASTNVFKEFFGHTPLVVRLFEFSAYEQQAIFEHHVPGEDFMAFQSEVSRFDLDALLPNPQFLKLFANAYIESNRKFTDKSSIFVQAVERSAREANPDVRNSNSNLSISQKIDIASEVFTKILLSGAEGVCISEVTEDRMYPSLSSVCNGDTAVADILATQLFKPGDTADQHRWVHKIIAEYCAADYLTKRIAIPTDPLTLSKCIPIIAPNSTVRDELRGLLGWMATLGNKPIEETLIQLDPYAVLANGDPSQLNHSSKLLLINKLKEISDEDPYFRRGDFRRRFSVVGFFTPAVIEEIKPLLTNRGNSHLRNLVLELLDGSRATEQLQNELRELVNASSEEENSRMLANSCLHNITGYDHYSLLDSLISEASVTSLKIVSETLMKLGLEQIELVYIERFLRACTNLYRNFRGGSERIVIGEQYFVRIFIEALDLATIEWLLDELTKNLSCQCGKQSYECDCRIGISKLTGLLMDNYFELATPPFDPERVWKWVENLNFHVSIDSTQSMSVQILQENDKLRQGIMAIVFGRLTDRDQIFNAKVNKFNSYTHSGLIFLNDDYKFIVDLAFKTNNAELWLSFMSRHNQYYGRKQPDSLRRHMRDQALENPLFMRVWAKSNKDVARDKIERKRMFKRSRNIGRIRRKRKENTAANIKYVQDNRELVESGYHWNCLVRFADLVLLAPDKIEQEFGDEKLVRNALKNCLEFIAPQVPNLQELALLRCTSKRMPSERILYAACLEIMREKGNLEDVDLHLLRALRTNILMNYRSVPRDECDALVSEIDSHIFPDALSIESFIRQYLEPQLAESNCKHINLSILSNQETFSQLRVSLSIEWLKRFPNLPIGSLETLFEIAAQYGDRRTLEEIIELRCKEFMSEWPDKTDNKDIEQKRSFWLLRAWYFLDVPPQEYWCWLKADDNTILMLDNHSGWMNRGDLNYWPKLKTMQIEAILNAFIDKWPKVDLLGGTGRSKEADSYRFLRDIIWSLDSEDPDAAIPVLDRFLADPRFEDRHNILKTIRASQTRKKALRNFEPPTPQEIVNRLDSDEVVTVEGLRELLLHELQGLQKAIDGGEYDTADRFYENGKRLGEVQSTKIIAERLNLRLEPQGISVVLEHQLKNANRCDFTSTKMINGKSRLLVTEVKGQWHRELYTAASSQLNERYSIHPNAEQQGIYLAIWFGADEKVAGLIHNIETSQELKSSIEERMPQELRGLIDVFVLDVSKPK